MTEQEFNEKRLQGEIQGLSEPPQGETLIPEQPKLVPDLGTYLAVLEILQRPKQHLTTAPTFTPKNFAQQIQLSDDGVNKKLHIYINGAWADFTAD
jgi:hypothetical protein